MSRSPKKPSIADNMPGPNWITWAGGLAASIVAIVGFLSMIGVDWPLTEKSPVIQEFVQFDEVHDIEIEILKTKQRAIIRKDLYDSVESTKSLLNQFEGRADLNDVEAKIKASWETDIMDYTEQIREMAGNKE